MKPTARPRLQLHRTSLRPLTGSELVGVAGGDDTKIGNERDTYGGCNKPGEGPGNTVGAPCGATVYCEGQSLNIICVQY